jgi:sec-independent protein translocase protein TatA
MVLGMSTTELLIILLIIVIVFGASRLGKLGGAVGQSIRDFRDSLRSDDDDGLNPSPANKRK